MSTNITSLRTVLSFASSLLAQVPLLYNSPSAPPETLNHVPYIPFSGAPSCPTDSPLSCHNSTVAPDSCCFIYPGGQLLQTQFWDVSPSIGPDDSWTLHGLWPDLCDGTYPQYCHSTPRYSNISSILTAASQTELLKSMNTYWLPNRGSPDSFWEHEWNKHGTCVNTLAPSCYGSSYAVGDEVVDFFTRAVGLFQQLDTYAALAKAGILPSTRKTYTAAQIQDAISAVTGREVYLGCNRGRLNEVWYSFNVKGSLQGGEFVATEPVGKSFKNSRCPSRGIRYLPK